MFAVRAGGNESNIPQFDLSILHLRRSSNWFDLNTWILTIIVLFPICGKQFVQERLSQTCSAFGWIMLKNEDQLVHNHLVANQHSHGSCCSNHFAEISYNTGEPE